MQDFTGSTKRAYLLSTIRHNLDQMDDIELAIVLAWLKSGDLYKWGADLLTKKGGTAQDVINHAEGVAKAAEAAELAKKAEEDARRAAENQPRKTFYSSPLAAIQGRK